MYVSLESLCFLGLLALTSQLIISAVTGSAVVAARVLQHHRYGSEISRITEIYGALIVII